MKSLPAVSPATWRQRYEALRQHVLERPQILSADPLSRVVWFTRGLAGWMQSGRVVPAEPAPALAQPPPPPRCASAPPWQQQLTRLLAQMTVQHL